GKDYVSVTKRLVELRGIEHRFCDLSSEDRKTVGYREGSDIALDLAMQWNDLANDEINNVGFATEIAKYWPLREKAWLDRISDVLSKVVIFVCGDAHIETFSDLLARNKIESEVVSRGIGVTKRDDEFWKNVKEYLKGHHELSK